MISTFFMLYLTMFMGLNAIVVGVAFCVAKVWDAVNDPILATFVNNTRSKHGKYRVWILVGMLLNSVLLVFMFYPISGGIGLKYFYYIFLYVLWGMTFTMVDVPFWSMIPTIADTTDERNSVSALAKMIGGFGGFVIGSGGSVIIGLTFGKQNVWSYFVVASVAAVLLCGMLTLTLVGNREKYQIHNSNTKFSELFRIFKTNDQLRAYSLSYLLFVIGSNIALIQPIYLFIYDQSHLDFEKHFIIFNALSCSGQGITMLFYPQIAKKIPREKLYSIAYILGIIGLALMFAVFFVLGSNKLLNVIIVSIAGAMLMIGNGLNQIGSTVMIADVVDYEEYKTGLRCDSVVFSVQTLLYKLSSAVATLVLGFAVSLAGLPVIDLLTNTFAGAVTDKMLLILRIFMFVIPIPFVLLGYIIYKKKYKLFGSYYDNIKSSLDKTRQI